MSNDWTIDTYVLYKAAEQDGDAIELLNNVRRSKKMVCFDYERKIEKEYWKCFEKLKKDKVNCRFITKWFADVVGKTAQKHSGKIDAKHKKKFKALKFDNDDWAFVVVCSKSIDKNLVSEDSDYNRRVRAYLKSELKMNVLDVLEALNI